MDAVDPAAGGEGENAVEPAGDACCAPNGLAKGLEGERPGLAGCPKGEAEAAPKAEPEDAPKGEAEAAPKAEPEDAPKGEAGELPKGEAAGELLNGDTGVPPKAEAAGEELAPKGDEDGVAKAAKGLPAVDDAAEAAMLGRGVDAPRPEPGWEAEGRAKDAGFRMDPPPPPPAACPKREPAGADPAERKGDGAG